MLGIGWLELFVLILASYRLTHLLVFDTIAEPLRRWLAGVPRRASSAPGPARGAGHGYPRGRSPVGPVRAVVAALVECFWCAGVWVSGGLLLLYLVSPSPLVKGLLLVLAIAGGQALLESVTLPQR